MWKRRAVMALLGLAVFSGAWLILAIVKALWAHHPDLALAYIAQLLSMLYILVRFAR